MLDTDMPTYEKGSVLALTPPEDEFDPFWLCLVESTVTAELTDPNIKDIDLPITFLEVVVGDNYERGETTTTPFDSVISVVRKAGAELGVTFKLSAKERSAIGEQQEKCAQECAADGQGLDEGKLMATFPVAESTEQLTVARPSATAIKGVEATASNAGADQEPCVQCDRCGKWRALADVTALHDKWFCELNTDGRYSSCEVTEHDWGEDCHDRQAASGAGTSANARGDTLMAELARRGLVRRAKSLSSQQKGVSWYKQTMKWRAEVRHGGKQEHLGYFATKDDAKARYDARCLELDLDPDAGKSLGFHGVSWDKTSSKWRAKIESDGKQKSLGYFEATARGEVDAALAFDAAARAAGRPEKANFEL